MRMTDVIQPEMIWADIKADTKTAVIRELAENIARSLGQNDPEKIVVTLSEREKLGSTGIQDGIAIPHGKIPGLEKIIVACGRSIKGIEFDAHDLKLTHLFFVLLAPEFAAGQHLKTLARLSKLLKNGRFRDKLMTAENAKEMFDAIVSEDEKL